MRLRRCLGDGARDGGGGPPKFNPLGGFPHSWGCRTWPLEDCRGGTSRLGALLGDLIDEGEDFRCISGLFWLFSAWFLGWERGLREGVEVVQELEGLLLLRFRLRFRLLLRGGGHIVSCG